MISSGDHTDDQCDITNRQTDKQYRQTDRQGGAGGMNHLDRFRILGRFWWFQIKEIAVDAWFLAVPIFVTTGLIGLAVKFWWWVLA